LIRTKFFKGRSQGGLFYCLRFGGYYGIDVLAEKFKEPKI